MTKKSKTRRAFGRAHMPSPPILTFQNLVASSLVAKGMTDEVWWQLDLNWRQFLASFPRYYHMYRVRDWLRPREVLQFATRHLKLEVVYFLDSILASIDGFHRSIDSVDFQVYLWVFIWKSKCHYDLQIVALVI